MSLRRPLLASAAAALAIAACSRSDVLDETPPGPPVIDAGAGADVGDPCASRGGTLCAGVCVDLQTDDANCGACGHACGPGGGCVGGVCGSPACPAGFQVCAHGCTDIATDPANCGGCGAACPSWDGCAAGMCVPSCPFVASRFPASSNPRFEPGLVAAGDLDGNGSPDLAVAGFYGTPDQRTLGEVDLLFNQGGGAFAGPATTTLALSENTCGVAVAPFRAGGGSTSDVAACAYDFPAQIFHDDGTGHFIAGPALAAAPYPQAMVAADFDGDGRPDLALVEQDQIGGPPASLVTLRNTGGGTFTAIALAEDPAKPQAARLLAGDLDGDGHPDLVGLPETSELHVYLGRADGSFTARPAFALPVYARDGALGDVDGDGRTDLVLALSDGSTRIYAGDGAGGFTAGAALAAGPQSMGMVIADFDGDGRQDVAVADYFAGAVAVFPGLGGGAFGAPAVCTAGYSPEGLASADLDSDGAPDIVTVDYYGQVTVMLYRGPRQ